MPTISVDKYALFEALGQKFTTAEFEDLCFDFGIELDEDTESSGAPADQQPPQLKIEIPANRYDMLCFEGLVLALNIFRGNASLPAYRMTAPPGGGGDLLSFTVSPDTLGVRKYVAGAVLRNISFTPASYDSFIALQDKLHQNLARQRTLVAIGTHDLDTLTPPFTYEALPPNDINFVPLNQTKSMTGSELMQFYDADKHISRYLHIIRDSPRYPVILDSKRTVCSLPPIINSDHSKITLSTKNVFIDATATDAVKLDIVINLISALFSVHCSDQFAVEQVQIVSDHNGMTRKTPQLATRLMAADTAYLNECCGLSLTPQEQCDLLRRMEYDAKPAAAQPPGKELAAEGGAAAAAAPPSGRLDVWVPVTRADVLQQCDIMEDLAIGYGYNKLPRMQPNKSATIAKALPINRLADILRAEAAMAGWREVLPLVLCSHDENFAWLNRQDVATAGAADVAAATANPSSAAASSSQSRALAVKLANPKTAEYQVVRTSLLPGLLKTLRENKHHALPLRIFEAADVTLQAPERERKAHNQRRFGAAFCGKSSGFEVVHGLLNRLMLMLRLPFIGAVDAKSVAAKGGHGDGYWLEPVEEPTFFPGHAAAVVVRLGGKTQRVGEFGILHPTVLDKFELRYPVSTLEFDVEVFL